MGVEQKLGIKVFYYYLSKRVLVGVFLLIVSLIISFLKNILVSKMFFILPVSVASALVYYLVLFLFLASVLFIAGAFLISWLNYISCVFVLDEDSFDIRRGILNKREVSIPYRQIQDIDIDQSFYDKMLGVSRLVILTAGNDDHDKEGEAEATFQVIDSMLAEKLREELLEKTSVQKVTETKS